MKQNDSKYHELYLMLKDADDYFPKEERTELLNLIKELYNDNVDNIDDSKGKYGIKYRTVHDDSKHHDEHIKFFRSKAFRDKVFDDWENERYWDAIMYQELEYPTPSPNFHNAIKVFKEGKEVYEEK